MIASNTNSSSSQEPSRTYWRCFFVNEAMLSPHVLTGFSGCCNLISSHHFKHDTPKAVIFRDEASYTSGFYSSEVTRTPGFPLPSAPLPPRTIISVSGILSIKVKGYADASY